MISGEPERSVAARFGLTPASVHRHRVGHLTADLAVARDRAAREQRTEVLGSTNDRAQVGDREDSELDRQRARVDDLGALWTKLRDRAERILADAEAKQDARTALRALRELRGLLGLAVDAASTIQRGEGGAGLLERHPDYARLTAAITGALEGHPEARRAVVAALEGLTREAV
ncbi:MAG: hypothetical protein ACODAA_03950 [Gemmatimonadota bacterium]